MQLQHPSSDKYDDNHGQIHGFSQAHVDFYFRCCKSRNFTNN